jgi:hypothetical protein
MAQKRIPDDANRQPRLRVSREEAARRIGEQIDAGKRLRQHSGIYAFEAALDAAAGEFSIWWHYCRDLLSALFDSDDRSDEFARAYPERTYLMNASLREKADEFRKRVSTLVTSLVSIRNRLEFCAEPGDPIEARREVGQPIRPAPQGRRVFVVHGHDEAAKQTVARFLEKLDLEAVILHEQASQGRTIIEKLEEQRDIAFAVILLTGDDLGAEKGKADKLQPRARQNVVFEWGRFIAILGRERVYALYEQGVELPSDLHDVIHTPLDPAGAWKMDLAKEIKAAKLDIDLDEAL